MNAPAISLRHQAARSLRSFGLPLAILPLFAFFVWLQPAMASLGSLQNLAKQISLLFVVAAAQLVVLVARGFDLSVGANASVVSVVSCMAMVAVADHAPGVVLAVGVLVAVAIGLVIGAANGLLIAFLGVNPFVVTLGTMSVVGGLATTLSNGFPIFGVPAVFPYVFNQMNWLTLPAPVTAAILFALALHFVLTRTAHGRTLYLIGDNARAAEVAGRAVKLHLFFAYVSCGTLAAIGGLLMTAQTGSGEPNMGASLALNSIAAAVVGGASLRGGLGAVTAPLLGSALVTLVSIGMNLARVDGSLQSVAIGFVVIGATLFGSLEERAR